MTAAAAAIAAPAPAPKPAKPAHPAPKHRVHWRVAQLGSTGYQVRRLEHRLVRLRFLPYGAADKRFDLRTWHAVVAFQGWTGLPADGVIDRRTRLAMWRAARPKPWSRRRGFEIHLDRQVMLIVGSHRNVARAIHISSGAGGGTPIGHFRIGRRERLSWSLKYKAWMPLAQYFTPAHALHEFFSVPAYPASHGCVRVPQPEAAVAWRYGRVGMRVWTVGR